MTRTQITLFNCYSRFMREWLKTYSDGLYHYELTHYSLSIHTGKKLISWQIMEKIKEITRNVSWEIRYDENGLIIKFWK